MKSGSRIRVIAQLISADEDAHIWSGKYDRELTDVFEIQDEISAEILQALNVHLSVPDEKRTRTANLDAYDAYLMGLSQYFRHQLDAAVESFRIAISLDPDYADAYGKLALTYDLYIWWQRRPSMEMLPLIRQNVDKALSLNPNQPDALILGSVSRFFVDRAYQYAIDEMSGLSQKRPNMPLYYYTYYGCIYRTIGHWDLSLKIHDRITELDPLNPHAHLSSGLSFTEAGRLQEARLSYGRAEALGLDLPVHLAYVAFLEGNTRSLRDQLDRSRSDWPPPSDQWYALLEAAASFLNGDQSAVKQMLAPLWQSKGYTSFWLKSQMAALEGDLDLALDYYARALSEAESDAFQCIQALWLVHRIFPDYRSHPKYQKMLKDVGLDEESIAKLKIPPLPF